MNVALHSEKREGSQLVTIGLPIYNGERFARRALEALLSQTYPNFEIIISDNCSTDSTRAICEEFVHRDKRISYSIREQNRGPVANFRYVLDQARGEIFMWAAHDDLWEPTHLMDAVRLLQDDSVEFVFPTFQLQSIRWGIKKKFDRAVFSFMESTNRRHRVLSFITLHYLSHSANIVYSVFRRSFLEKVWAIQNIGNDGAMGAVILSMGRGALNTSRFSKRYEFLWPGRLQILVATAFNTRRKKNALANTLDAISNGRKTLTRLLPEFEAEIDRAYDQYEPYSYQQNYRICALEEVCPRCGADGDTSFETRYGA